MDTRHDMSMFVLESYKWKWMSSVEIEEEEGTEKRKKKLLDKLRDKKEMKK